MTENGSDWEQAKENIRPLRQGRKMACLRAALAPRVGPGNQQRHQQQQAFENELRTYDGDDPMSVWHKYIEWVEQNYPKGGNSGNFQQLIGQCVSSFLEDERYQNDKRYIDVWLKYATNFTNTLEIYSYMYSRDIGCKSATFFENWAWELQQLGNTKKAYAILQEGLQRLAEPRKILLVAEKALQAKMVEKCKDYNISEEQTDVEQHRSALNSLRPIGNNNRAPIRRVGDARLEESVPLPPVQQLTSQSSRPFQVFNDENTFPSHLPTSKESSSKLVSKDHLNKENDLKPGKWNGAALKSKSGSQSHSRDNNPGFTIHQDENDPVPLQSSVKLPTNHHILSSRKVHYSPPRVLFEPPNPNVVPMYNKYKVYAGAEEFQFEEIRAARWLAKRKEEECFIEEKRKRALEDEVRLLKDDLMKLKLQISTSDNMSQLSTTSTTSSANRSPIEEEQRTNPLGNCYVESAAPAQPTEVRVTGSQSISLNPSPTRQVQALWNVSLFHNSNHKTDPEDDQSGLSLHRNLPFKIHEDSKVLKEDDQENLKENQPPKEYVQSHCKRSLAGILQQSTNVPMLPLEEQDSDDSEDEDDNLGTCPLPPSQETTVAVVSPEQFNEDVARQCASTPFQKTFVPPSEDDGFTSSLASVIISAIPNWTSSGSDDAKEIVTATKTQESCITMPGNTRMSLGGVKNLSPIMEGSREERYKSSSSSSSSGPYSTTTSTYYHHQTTTHTTSKSLHSLPQQQTVHNNTKASNEDFIRPKTPEHSIAPSSNIDPFCGELQKRLLKNLKKPLCKRCGYELKSKNMPRTGRESYFVIGDKTYTVLEELWKGSNGTVFLAEENYNLEMSISDSFNAKPNNVVLKVNKPASEWEFYISTELHERLRSKSASCNVTRSIMLVEHAQIYNDKSILISSYAKFGTLVDLVNLVVKKNESMSETVVLYFTLEMLQIVSQLHSCHIIHADIKPDNFVIINLPDSAVTKENEALDKTMCLRLIDFGQSIDMQLFPSGTTFNQSVQTSGFQCTEMQEHKPWTYQTDMYGLLGSIHILIFSKYMEVRKNSDGQWEPTSKFKRYWQRDLWQNLFHTLLNIPSCENIPDLQPFIETIKNQLGQPRRWRELQVAGSHMLCKFTTRTGK